MSASPFPLPPEVWKIHNDSGVWRADGPQQVAVEGGRLFMHNIVRKAPIPDHRRWLVAELDGVRVYIERGEILITRRQLSR